VLPVNPQHLVQSAARPVLDELAATLDDVARAVRERNRGGAEKALERARAIDELSGRFTDAVSTGHEATRFAPQRRRYRTAMDEWGEMARSIDLAVRNVRVLARGTIRALRFDENVPEDVGTALRDLAEAVRAIGGALDEGGDLDAVREPALRAAARATRVLETTTNMSVSVIVGQIRSTANDLLTGTGMDVDAAAKAVTDAVRAG
jgi:hypothetical protein